MTTFVLVHGAWHGAWAWSRLTPLLTARGASVMAPDLAVAPDVGLSAHVGQVVAGIDATVGDCVLVGHSYGGLVVRQAADQRPGRVSRVVLVDGWGGGDGASLVDLAPPWFGDLVTGVARDGLVPPPGPDAFGVTGADLAGARLRPHPLRTFTEPARLTGAVDGVPGVGIVSSQDQMPFAALAAGLGYEVVPLDGPHDLMLTHAGGLATAIL